ncbi:MAG: hypothetical protein NVS3B5_01520 [Sphingomicrobium sp.]
MRNFVLAMSVSAALFTSSASAGELSEIDNSFIVSSLGALLVAVNCPGYSGIDGSAPRIADRIGAKPELISAISAAIAVNVGLPYERSDLIPEVTAKVRETYKVVGGMIDHGQRKVICDKLGNVYVDAGFIERSSGAKQ